MEIVKNQLFRNVYEADCFSKEFREMTKEKTVLNPPYPRYQKWLLRSLTILEELGREALKLSGFEQLKDTEPELCSIRYPHSPLNPRVLFMYLGEGNILLLTAFKEKNKSDYARNIVVAQSRAEILLC